MRHFVFRWLATTVAVMVAASIIHGIRYDSVGSLVGAALLLGILNAFVRPVLLILSAPIILVTLGFFILIVNGLLLWFVPNIVTGFHVDNFGSAFWGAIVIGIVSWILSAFFRGSDGRVHKGRRRAGRTPRDRSRHQERSLSSFAITSRARCGAPPIAVGIPGHFATTLAETRHSLLRALRWIADTARMSVDCRQNMLRFGL